MLKLVGVKAPKRHLVNESINTDTMPKWLELKATGELELAVERT
jgi:hypothetical protein